MDVAVWKGKTEDWRQRCGLDRTKTGGAFGATAKAVMGDQKTEEGGKGGLVLGENKIQCALFIH